jgi:hypothetical protein
MTDLSAAIAQAAKTRRAVMAVFPHPALTHANQDVRPSRGSRPDIPPGLTGAQKSQKVVLTNSRGFRVAVRNSAMIAVRVSRPKMLPFMYTRRRWTAEETKQAQEYNRQLKAYEDALKKYGIADSLPAVVFLAPDGSALKKLVAPHEEPKLIQAIRAVPPLLAAWLTANRVHLKRPGVEGGIRADAPRSIGGVRADRPAK